MKRIFLLCLALVSLAEARPHWTMWKTSSAPPAAPAVVNAWNWIGGAVGASMALSGNGTSTTYTPGNCLVVWVAHSNGTGPTALTVTDNNSNSYTMIALTATPTTFVGGPNAAFFILPNAPAGITSLNVGLAGGQFPFVILQEVSGVSKTTPYTTGEAIPTAAGISGSNPTTGSVNHATANSIILAGLVDDDNTQTINGTGTIPSSWSLFDATYSQNNNSSQEIGSVPTILAPLTGVANYAHGWTCGSSANNSCSILVLHP